MGYFENGFSNHVQSNANSAIVFESIE